MGGSRALVVCTSCFMLWVRVCLLWRLLPHLLQLGPGLDDGRT